MSAQETVEAVFAAAQIAVLLPISPIVRRWYNHAGASSTEVQTRYSTDSLVPSPQQGYTRAISIRAPKEIVWGYLMQLGQERAGLYSYDALENLVGCEMHTVDHLVPEWQNLKVGDVVRFGPAAKGYPTQKVIEVQDKRLIVWQGVDAKTLEAGGGLNGIIAYYLSDAPDGGTRLIVRSAMSYPPTFAMKLLWRITEVLNYVMEQKMLRSIRAFAERDARRMTGAAAPA
ncbi:MAG: hypothetical protein IPK19_01935 [Chloroflexi bacterium]|nr:hypothetical protein [Chloroflexota bacterium]